MTDTNKNFSQDEELSDFADRVLKGQIKDSASDSDTELRGLEQTILRLHDTMPSSSLEEATKKQMLVRLNARIRREKEQAQGRSFWDSLFNTQGRGNQFAVAMGVLALLVTAVILSPNLVDPGSSGTTGTALGGSNGFILPVILIGLIVLILWLKRKP